MQTLETIKLLPIIAFEAFRRDFPKLNFREALHYVKEQKAMK